MFVDLFGEGDEYCFDLMGSGMVLESGPELPAYAVEFAGSGRERADQDDRCRCVTQLGYLNVSFRRS